MTTAVEDIELEEDDEDMLDDDVTESEAFGADAFLSRALEAFKVMSPSPAVQLMMYARVLEMAADSFMRRGKLIHVERGKGGKFARKGLGETIGDAVGAMSDAFSGRDSSGRKDTDRIRDAYKELQRHPGDYVALADLRERLGGMSRADQDAALEKLGTTKGVNLITWDNTKALRQRDHDAALRWGGDDNHVIRFEPGFEDEPGPSDTPAQKRKKALDLLDDMPTDKSERDRVHTEVGGLILDADRMDAAKPARRPKKTPVDMGSLIGSLRDKKSTDDYVDVDAVAADLKGLSHKELDQIKAEFGYDWVKGTREQKAKQIADTLYSAKNSDIAIRRGSQRFAEERRQADKPLSVFGQIKAGHAAAVERDRERLARKAASPAADTPKPDMSVSITGQPRWIKPPDEPFERRRSMADSLRGTKPKRTREPRGDVSSAVDSLRPMVDNPKSGDGEKTEEILAKLTGKQLDDVAAEFGYGDVVRGTTTKKRRDLAKLLVGSRLTTQAVTSSSGGSSGAPAASRVDVPGIRPTATRGARSPRRKPIDPTIAEGAYGASVTRALFGETPLPGSKAYTRRRAELDEKLQGSTDPAELAAAAEEWNRMTGLEPHPWLVTYGSDFKKMAAGNRAQNGGGRGPKG